MSLGVIILNIVAYGKKTICAAFPGNENDFSTGIARYCHSKFLTSFFRNFIIEQNPWYSGDLSAELDSNIHIMFSMYSY